MSAYRRLTVVVTTPLLVTGLTGAPAEAHGAPSRPISRAAACGPEGGEAAKSAACRAAREANGRSTLEDWDNIRVANVAGRDRSVIPDGELCSGGNAEFHGLDLPRQDWPATTLTPGASLTFAYRTTIPHEGEFRFYVTRDGYNPRRALRWADLETKPFLEATDPALSSGSYRMKGKLPAGKSGRHVIYTIWQNSSTPDTYYSCSDVIFRAAKATEKPSPRAETSSAAPAAEGLGGSDQASVVPADEPTPTLGPDTVLAAGRERNSLLPLVVGAVLLVLISAAAIIGIRRRRRS